jgi:hypothetical protein
VVGLAMGRVPLIRSKASILVVGEVFHPAPELGLPNNNPHALRAFHPYMGLRCKSNSVGPSRQAAPP